MNALIALGLAAALSSTAAANPAGLTVGEKDKDAPGTKAASSSPAGGGVSSKSSVSSSTQPVAARNFAAGDDDIATNPPAPQSTAEGAGFQEIDLGLIPTLSRVYGAGGARPVVKIGGGQKWAIKIRHRGSSRANYPILLGGTNGNITGGGRYTYRAAFSARKGDAAGAGACAGQMANAAYVTCQQPCSMHWHLGVNQGGNVDPGICRLEADKDYWLNIEPIGPGCVGGEAEAHGCPLVMEWANGGQIYLNPGGPEAACLNAGGGSYTAELGCR